MKHMKVFAAVVALVGAAVLGACSSGFDGSESGPASAADRTVEESCKVVEEAKKEFDDQFSAILDDGQPETAEEVTKIYSGVRDSLNKYAETIKNKDVRSAWEQYVEATKDMMKIYEEMSIAFLDGGELSDDQMDDLMKRETEITEKTDDAETKLEEICGLSSGSQS